MQLFLANIIISGTIKCAVTKHSSCYFGALNNPCANMICEYIIVNLLIIYLKYLLIMCSVPNIFQGLGIQ